MACERLFAFELVEPLNGKSRLHGSDGKDDVSLHFVTVRFYPMNGHGRAVLQKFIVILIAEDDLQWSRLLEMPIMRRLTPIRASATSSRLQVKP